eukprot:47446_1
MVTMALKLSDDCDFRIKMPEWSLSVSIRADNIIASESQSLDEKSSMFLPFICCIFTQNVRYCKSCICLNFGLIGFNYTIYSIFNCNISIISILYCWDTSW